MDQKPGKEGGTGKSKTGVEKFSKGSKTHIIQEIENGFQNLIENAVIGIGHTNENGDYLFANRRLAHIYGYKTKENFLKSHPNVTRFMLNPEERISILERMKTRGFIDGAEIQCRRRDGEIIWISLSARVVKGRSRAITYESFIIDISDKKAATIALQESEKRFRMLVEQAGDAFFIHDYAGRILDVNLTACEMLGYSKDELLKMRISDVDMDVAAKGHRDRYWDPLQSEKHITFEGVQRRKDGSTFPVEVRLGRVDLEETPLLLSLTRDVTKRKESENELKRAFKEINELKNQLEEENIYLRREVETRYRHKEIVGESRAIKKVLMAVERVARENTSVLITGETGTGKEMLARAIHNLSPRNVRSMITVNCAALPGSLIESELFGREKGAFTGAASRQSGRFEAADKSTIFLDEIGDLPMELQAKLLRVLENGTFERLGSSKSISVDVRVIAATNHDLAELVRNDMFRRDLFYRLNVFPIVIPPLRERKEDIPLLVWAFVEEFSQSMGKSINNIPKKIMDELQEYQWPGNVRELKNVIERGMIMSSGSTLRLEQQHAEIASTIKNISMEDVEREHIKQVLRSTGWRVTGKNGASRILGMKDSTLRSRMIKLGITRP
ncbi:MAG: sigma 54-interacting transcriptional regulator [Methanomicrobiaceae archaeon]|nr:sigma 54-interacting transcriptional regulator [Methanomicrobiaceae archaeon]